MHNETPRTPHSVAAVRPQVIASVAKDVGNQSLAMIMPGGDGKQLLWKNGLD